MKVRNVREYALTIAATGQKVEPGDEVEVPDWLGHSLCEQPANWAPVKQSSAKKAADPESQED